MNDTDKNTDSVEQMREGAKQLAAGTKTFVETRLAPTAKKAALDAKNDFTARSASAGGVLPLLTSYARIVLLSATALYFIGLFLPMYRHTSYIQGPTGDAVVVILLLLAVVALGIISMKIDNKALRSVTAVVAIIVGICGLSGGFGNIPNLGLSLGALAIGFAGLGQIAAAILILINKKVASDR